MEIGENKKFWKFPTTQLEVKNTFREDISLFSLDWSDVDKETASHQHFVLPLPMKKFVDDARFLMSSTDLLIIRQHVIQARSEKLFDDCIYAKAPDEGIPAYATFMAHIKYVFRALADNLQDPTCRDRKAHKYAEYPLKNNYFHAALLRFWLASEEVFTSLSLAEMDQVSEDSTLWEQLRKPLDKLVKQDNRKGVKNDKSSKRRASLRSER